MKIVWRVMYRSCGGFEGLGICEKGKVHQEFLDGIAFTGSRYSVKLPWKESHDKLPDDYANSLGRMKNQLRRLKKEAALLTEYDSIIREQVERGIVETVAALDTVDKQWCSQTFIFGGGRSERQGRPKNFSRNNLFFATCPPPPLVAKKISVSVPF